MKKIFLSLIVVCCFVILLLSLSSCESSVPHVHSYGEWNTTKEATCTESGEQVRYCSCGETQTQSIPATGHSFGEWETTIEPNCTEAGKKERTCACGETQSQSIPATGHSYGDWVTAVEPTCTESGKKERICVCGQKQEQSIAPKGHSFGEWITTKEPTCTENGEKEHYCSCGEKQVQTIAAKGHSFGGWVVTKTPTCTEVGERERVCSCGEKQIETLAANGHKLGEWIIDKEATCASTGSKHRNCTVCGLTIETSVIPKNQNHKYDEGKIITQPTCTVAGTKEVTCSICKTKSTVSVPPLGHDFDSSGVCKRCGIREFKLTTKEKQDSVKVKTMSHSVYDYSDSLVLNITFKDSNGYSLNVPAYVSVRIVNSKGATVYNQTLVLSSSESSITIKNSDITAGTVSDGIIYYRVYSTGYFSFDEVSKRVEKLPWTVYIKLPTVPSTYNYYNYDNSISSSCKVTSITYTLSGSTLTIQVTGEKTYDKSGNNQSSSCKIGWKLYDSDGFVIKSGTIYSESVKVGERFKEKCTVYNIEQGEDYTLVFSHVN